MLIKFGHCFILAQLVAFSKYWKYVSFSTMENLNI